MSLKVNGIEESVKSETADTEVGVTFNEMYHELFMAILSTVKRFDTETKLSDKNEFTKKSS